MKKCLECVWYVRTKRLDYCKAKSEFCPLNYVNCAKFMSKDDLEIEKLKKFKEWVKEYRSWDEERKEKWFYDRWKDSES